jgi:hypothetical protein
MKCRASPIPLLDAKKVSFIWEIVLAKASGGRARSVYTLEG